MRDKIFLLEPAFLEDGERWFCPYSAKVVGFMTYFPEVRGTLDVQEVGIEKPRKPIVALIGEELQSCPVMVLAPESPLPTELEKDVVVSKGHRVISDTDAILCYLALTRKLPKPH